MLNGGMIRVKIPCFMKNTPKDAMLWGVFLCMVFVGLGMNAGFAQTIRDDNGNIFRPKSRPADMILPEYIPSVKAVEPTATGEDPQSITTIIPTIFAKDKLSLVGIFGREGAYRALFRTPFGRYIRVKVGQKISGWQVVKIEPASVVLEKKDRVEVLEIQP